VKVIESFGRFKGRLLLDRDVELFHISLLSANRHFADELFCGFDLILRLKGTSFLNIVCSSFWKLWRVLDVWTVG